jgi:predicted PurR-regulated permease PerM
MTDASTSPHVRGTDDPTPLAADSAAGTDERFDIARTAGDVGTIVRQQEQPDASRQRWANLNHPFAVGFTITLGGLSAALLLLTLSNISTIVIYVVFALFAALGLDPVVKFFERHGVKRPWGIVIVYFSFAVVLVAVLWLVIPTLVEQIGLLIKNFPETIANFENSDFYAWIESTFGASVGQFLDEAEKWIANPANIAAIGGGVVKLGVTIGTTISGLLIILVLSLYFLASIPARKVSFARLAPARNRPKVLDLTNQITDSIGGYLVGMVILAFCNSIVATLLHLFLGLPFPVLMGVVAFLITLIPLIGSVLYWMVASTLALFTSPVAALIFAVIYLIYIQLEAYVLTPRVMNRAVSVPGALVVIGALVGGTLLGLLGALVAIPITASILLIIKQIAIPRQDAKT